MSIREISKELIKAFTTNNKRLARLDFSKNQIKVIQNLNELKHLQILNLSHNQIEQIDGLNELITLQQVDLSNNLISTVNNMRNLKSLQFIDLSFNRINDIKDLGELKHNKKLQELNVQGNSNITCYHDYRERIKQIIPQLEKIDGLKVHLNEEEQSIPAEEIEQKQIQALQDVIAILERQVQPQHNIDILQAWRKKCHELLLREKIMNLRFNKLDNAQNNLIQQKQHLEGEVQSRKEEIVRLKEDKEQQQLKFEKQLKRDTTIIYTQFEQQMTQMQDMFNQSIKLQEKRFFILEGTLLKQKQKILSQKRMVSNDFFEFKQSLKTIIQTYTQKDIQYDINSNDFLNEVQKTIRNSLIQLQDTQFKQETTSKYEIQQFQEEINSLNQQKKNLSSLLQDMEERIQKISRNNEQKQKEIIEELEFKTKKVKEQNQTIYDLESKLDKESQEKHQNQTKLIEIQDNLEKEIKRKVEEQTNRLKQRAEELEKENLKLNSNIKGKDLEAIQLTEQLDKKILQIEIEKNNEINTLESQLQIETEKRIMISNQRNDMVRIINMKENKIKEIRNEQRQLQEKLNQTVQADFYQNKGDYYQNKGEYYQNKGNISQQDMQNNQNQMMTYQNQRLLQNQLRPSQNIYNTSTNDNNLYKNYENYNNNDNINNGYNNNNPRLNQTDINYKTYQRSQEDWSPIGNSKNNNTINNNNNNNSNNNGNKIPFRQGNKSQEINNFTTNKANMILNDLSMINNEQGCGDTLEDVIKKCDYNEKFAEDLFNDDI